jgi:Tripartite tricarboxylate transporter TctB family
MAVNNRNLLKGLFLIAIAMAFGIGSLNYPIGSLDHAGPGMFPLLVSALLFLVGVAMVVRSRALQGIPMQFNLKNIAIIMAALCGFALLSEFVNMIVGIVFLVFCATFTGTSYSVMRNFKIAAVLVGIALALKLLLGVQLPLY